MGRPLSVPGTADTLPLPLLLEIELMPNFVNLRNPRLTFLSFSLSLFILSVFENVCFSSHPHFFFSVFAAYLSFVLPSSTVILTRLCGLACFAGCILLSPSYVGVPRPRVTLEGSDFT